MEEIIPENFGKMLRTLRVKAGLTLREICRENNIDPGNYSRLERGLLDPPSCRDYVEYYAELVRVNKKDTEMLVRMAYEHHEEKLKVDFRIKRFVDAI